MPAPHVGSSMSCSGMRTFLFENVSRRKALAWRTSFSMRAISKPYPYLPFRTCVGNLTSVCNDLPLLPLIASIAFETLTPAKPNPYMHSLAAQGGSHS